MTTPVHLPVLDDDRLVGMVSDALAAEAHGRLDEYRGGVRRWEVFVADRVATVAGTFGDAGEGRAVRVLVGSVPGIRTVRLDATEER